MAVCCCFHNQIKNVCDFCIPKRKFVPKIEYQVDDDQIFVNKSQEMVSGTNLKDPYDNHSLKNISEQKPAGGVLANPVKDEKQKSADQPELSCDGGPSAAPAKQGKLDCGPKTTRSVELEAGSQAVTVKTAPGYKFEFKEKKAKIKN